VNGCSTSNTAGVSLTNPGAPDVQDVANQIICDGSFTLPTIVVTGTATSSGYFSGPNGTGTPISAGTTFSGTTDTLIYIYAVNGPCTDQENFTITINLTPTITNPGTLSGCDQVTLPAISGSNLSGNESYFTDSQLNGGVPTLGPITNSGTVYIFDQNGTCSSEISFAVNVTPTPVLTPVTTLTGCDQVILGTIQGNFLSGNEAYYNNSQSNGGTVLSSLTLTNSQTVYIYDSNNGCSDEISFDVVINTTPVLNTPNDTTVCGLFILPTITGTNLTGNEAYFNGPQASNPSQINGQVSTNQVVYIYDSNNGCDDETSFQVTVLSSPILNVPATAEACDSYILPTIDGLNLSGNQNYYTNTQAQGGTVLAGPLTNSGWIYVFDSNGTCDAEDSTFVTINATPVITTTAPAAVCAPNTVDITAASVTSGSTNLGAINYFSDAGATTVLSNPTAVNASGTYFLVSSNGNCSDTASVQVTINPLDVASTSFTDYCEGSPTTPVITGQTGGTFTFTTAVTDGATIDANTGVIANGVGGTTYSVSYTTNGTCPITTDGTVTVNAIPDAPIMSNDTTYCSAQVKIPMTAQGTDINWFLTSDLNSSVASGNSYNPTFSQSSVFYATQTVNGCESPADSIIVTIQTCGITIPTAITPNNDQIHDTWELNNLDLNFPKNVVYIYDRWGSLIFKSEEGNYNAKPWDGTYNEKELPVGSYYFIVEFNDEATENEKGTVSIIKK
jgi:gliding motility-associated-like protein